MMDKNVVILKGLIYQSALEFLWKEGFIVIPYEGITNATGSCEAVSNVFKIDDDRFQTLSQTVQLHLERDIILNGLPRMASTNRSFRKDNKNWKSDGRHLNDFELLETEALDTDLDWLLIHCEKLLKHVFKNVLNISSKYGLLSPIQHHNLYKYYEKGFLTLTYTQAIDHLKEIDIQISWGDDLTSTHEKKLTEIFDSNLMVTHYPEKIKFFNMQLTRDNNGSIEHWKENDHQTVDCVDVILMNAGESIGGSVREYDYDIIKDRLYSGTMIHQLEELKTKHDNKPEEIITMFEGYLDLFKNNPIKRSGMGLGFGRVAQFILNTENVISF